MTACGAAPWTGTQPNLEKRPMHGQNPERRWDSPLTSLVFPTYNPGPHLESTCEQVTRFLEDSPEEWEILFVCDGCTDGSPARLARFARLWPERIRVLSYAPNRGKGYAVRQGLAAARGGWRLFTDVDLAYSLDDVRRVAASLWAGNDLAIASRCHPQSRLLVVPGLEGYVYRRHLQSLVFSRLVRWLLPLTQRDTQAGLKGISAQAAQLLLPRLSCDGFGFDCELLTAGIRHGLRIAEVPVCVRYDAVPSTTGFRNMSGMVRDLWRIRKRWQSVIPQPAGELAARPQKQAA
jgi:dolichyl-phosphate beta-glucosyltransferase